MLNVDSVELTDCNGIEITFTDNEGIESARIHIDNKSAKDLIKMIKNQLKK